MAVRPPVSRFLRTVPLIALLSLQGQYPHAQEAVISDKELPPPEYIIGVEDRLDVFVYGEPDLTRVVTVRPDGKITLPLVGDIQASGRTPRALTRELATSLERYLKEPLVTVIVDEINNFKVHILGQVRTQGELILRRPTRLIQALAMAGGLTEFAEKSNIVLIRYVEGREVRARIDYRKIVNGDRPELNVYLKPGDMIIAN